MDSYARPLDRIANTLNGHDSDGYGGACAEDLSGFAPGLTLAQA